MAPDPDEISGEIVGAEPFETQVYPPDSKRSDSHGAVGGSWDISDDPSVREYGTVKMRFLHFLFLDAICLIAFV